MTINTIVVLAIGTGAMLLPILIMSAIYKIRLWKAFPIAVILTVTGTLGTYIMFFVENLWFGGRSFYGAVFLVPLAFIFLSWLLRVPYGELMDLCAPAECVMLAIMKVQCIRDGCCRGRVLFVNSYGASVVFPSQLVEMGNALLLFLVLSLLAVPKRNRGYVYPWYLILYGTSRFVLNFFREEWALYSKGLPPLGSLWSLLAIAVGVIWIRKRRKIISAAAAAKESCSAGENHFAQNSM